MFEERQKSAAVPTVKHGTFVKVRVSGERFWCRVKHLRADGSVLAVLDNNLVKSRWKRGDEIVFQHGDVLETAEPADEHRFRSLVVGLGSVTDAAIAWQELRRAGGVAVVPHPETVYCLPGTPFGADARAQP